MTKEFDVLLTNGTQELFALLIGKKAITCKQIFRIKLEVDGALERYKARLMVKGFLQIDYGETFSPVIKPTTMGLC